eukprot:TCONS_00071609-protein
MKLNLVSRVVFLLLLNVVFTYGMPPMYEGIQHFSEHYNLPPLPFKFGSMEPQFDAPTMKIHYIEVHSNFTKNMNRLLKDWRKEDKDNPLTKKSLLDVIRNIGQVPHQMKYDLEQQIGGHLNHLFYFATLRANPKNETMEIPKKLQRAFKRSFVNMTLFETQFKESMDKVSSVGFVWLCRVPKRDYLTVYQTVENTSPLTLAGGLQPVLGIDLWEHAYWIKHPNRRDDYYKAWWSTIDWNKVEQLYQWWKNMEPRDEL